MLNPTQSPGTCVMCATQNVICVLLLNQVTGYMSCLCETSFATHTGIISIPLPLQNAEATPVDISIFWDRMAAWLGPQDTVLESGHCCHLANNAEVTFCVA